MNANTKIFLKRAWAVFAGFLAAGTLSALGDFSLQATALISFDNFKTAPTWVVIIITIYRFIFNSVGSYITAWLAPNHPMRLVMIGGGIGFVMSAVGASVMWEKAAPWYNIAIILIALPSAYAGGKMHESVHGSPESLATRTQRHEEI